MPDKDLMKHYQELEKIERELSGLVSRLEVILPLLPDCKPLKGARWFPKRAQESVEILCVELLGKVHTELRKS